MLCWECCTFGEMVVAATIRDGDIQGMLYPERAYKILDYPICHRLALARQQPWDLTTKIRAAVRTRGAERSAAT
jgi:hypothetical protein